MNHTLMSNDELFDLLERFAREERARLQEYLAALAVLDYRKAASERGYHSTFDYCVRKLKLSEDEAYKRIAAARATVIRPELLSAMTDNGLSLTAVTKLAPHVRRPEAAELISRAIGKSTRQIEEMLAPLCPEPPRRDMVREIVVATPYQDEARVEFKFQGSRELRAALDRVKQLMSHRHPSGALELVIFDLAQEYIARHDPVAPKMKGKSPAPGSSTIVAATRQIVWARDGGRCAYVGDSGVRCDSRMFLELDHITPRALGGSDDADNLRLLCRAHNDSERRRVLGEGWSAAAVQGRIQDYGGDGPIWTAAPSGERRESS